MLLEIDSASIDAAFSQERPPTEANHFLVMGSQCTFSMEPLLENTYGLTLLARINEITIRRNEFWNCVRVWKSFPG